MLDLAFNGGLEGTHEKKFKKCFFSENTTNFFLVENMGSVELNRIKPNNPRSNGFSPFHTLCEIVNWPKIVNVSRSKTVTKRLSKHFSDMSGIFIRISCNYQFPEKVT